MRSRNAGGAPAAALCGSATTSATAASAIQRRRFPGSAAAPKHEGLKIRTSQGIWHPSHFTRSMALHPTTTAAAGQLPVQHAEHAAGRLLRLLVEEGLVDHERSERQVEERLRVRVRVRVGVRVSVGVRFGVRVGIRVRVRSSWWQSTRSLHLSPAASTSACGLLRRCPPWCSRP